jgi:prepilin-type N-terminal cleavage/methylation domain-containing protein
MNNSGIKVVGWKTGDLGAGQTRTEARVRGGAGAFTLLELLVVITIIAILTSMLLPTLGRAKETARRINCINNMHQLSLSAMYYNEDNEERFPPRSGRERWPNLLLPYYSTTNVLRCPSDGPQPPPTIPGSRGPADSACRSFFINGWNDYFYATLTNYEFQLYMMGFSDQTYRDSYVRFPSETIVFCEKQNNSEHFYLDLEELEPSRDYADPSIRMGNDETELDQDRHSSGARQAQKGGSVFAFADGSARFLRHWTALGPVNLFCTRPEERSSPRYTVSF